MKKRVNFLGFIISHKGVEADFAKVQAVQNWPTPTNFSKVRSFHGLATFYWRFIRGFSTIMALITECLKANSFFWSTATANAFTEIKEKLRQALVLKVSNFSKVFEMASDVSDVGIGGILSQEGHPIVF